ncbi:hypothetical protein GGR55DRAFT_77120 [Xylaria sp. FL0064]|nr:hypothetical protein GGR55DRAFT_77120 [Xylaria sp. FL0064]
MPPSLASIVPTNTQHGHDYRWGFYVYRTTFEDEDLWRRYIYYIFDAVMENIERSSAELSRDLREELQSRFQLVLRGHRSLDGLTRDEARARFGLGISGGRGGASDHRWGRIGLHQWYFIYVDKDVLEQFRKIDDARARGPPDFIHDNVPVVMVDCHPQRWGPEPEKPAGWIQIWSNLHNVVRSECFGKGPAPDYVCTSKGWQYV